MRRTLSRPTVAAAVIGLGSVGVAALVTALVASDHQDTALVELRPTRDINDVYVFPGSSADRVALAVTTQSPVTPAETARARFDPNVLYQIKIDNTGDGVEDRVFQVTFKNVSGGGQTMAIRGPVTPPRTGTDNVLAPGEPALRGSTNAVIGSPSGLQAFAGIRADPFFLDLEQFFRIIPDRKPETGDLSRLPNTPSASSFRAQANNFFYNVNAMAIVLELPESWLGASPNGAVGVWATTSTAEELPPTS